MELSKGGAVRKGAGASASAEHGLPPDYVMLRASVRLDSVSVELSRANPKAVRWRVCDPASAACRVPGEYHGRTPL